MHCFQAEPQHQEETPWLYKCFCTIKNPNTNFPKLPLQSTWLCLIWISEKHLMEILSGENRKVCYNYICEEWFGKQISAWDGFILQMRRIVCTIGSSVSGTSSKPSTNVSKVPYKVRVDTKLFFGKFVVAAQTMRLLVGYTGKGTFTIIEEKAGTGSTKGWGKIEIRSRMDFSWLLAKTVIYVWAVNSAHVFHVTFGGKYGKITLQTILPQILSCTQ